MTHRIRAARWVEKDHVAAVIAEALKPTPIAAWLVPDEEQRCRVLTDVAGIWVEHAMFYGDVHVTSDLTAATVCFHRYRPLPPPASYTTRLATAAGPHAERFLALDDIIASRQPTEAHYQLAYLAVRPTHQRSGRGRALMDHLRRRLDLIGLPSWTLTLPGGEHLLARFGYEAEPAITPSVAGLKMHPMIRGTHRYGARPPDSGSTLMPSASPERTFGPSRATAPAKLAGDCMTQADGVFADPRRLAAAGSNSRPAPQHAPGQRMSWRQGQRLVLCGAQSRLQQHWPPLLDLSHARLRAGVSRLILALVEQMLPRWDVSRQPGWKLTTPCI
ncbi:GNAT family N-acetyltransferase [Micromonospora sp. NPDC047707]|uniref:GNAT family N-acetyltransferase n=1 Tax=Micromonospora sp. NPDC047707 TaxID=3154498 RepID=UPI0034554F4F